MRGAVKYRIGTAGQAREQILNNAPWFVGKDVADVLGYRDTSDALKKHVDEEDKLTRQIADSGQGRQMYIINESGLYSLILKSKLPNAKQFKRWVTSEVLPTIRKHGAYMTPSKIEEVLLNPDTIINLATQIKQERIEKEKADVAIYDGRQNLKMTVIDESGVYGLIIRSKIAQC